jgi:hypothetical protein
LRRSTVRRGARYRLASEWASRVLRETAMSTVASGPDRRAVSTAASGCAHLAHVQHQFAPYLAQELAPAEQAGVGSHLSHCPACATALVNFPQELHATTGLLGSLPRHAAPRALRERLLAVPDREVAGEGLGGP